MTDVRFVNLWQDNAGGLHLEASNGTMYHHVELADGSFEDDVAAIIEDDTSQWTIAIDTDTSIIDHPETQLIATHNGERWAMDSDARPNEGTLDYLGLPPIDYEVDQ